MITLNGAHNFAHVMVDKIEASAEEQIVTILSKKIFKDCQVRIMADVHAGKGCVVGFTSTLNSYIVPNLIGVDISCGILSYNLGQIKPDFKILDDLTVRRVYENNYDKVIAYMRGDLLFVFNFHPSISYTDYGIPVTGKFSIVLDTDNPSFGGFNRIDRNTIYISIRKAERNIINAPLYLYLYLPARTALVFKKEPVRRATDI